MIFEVSKLALVVSCNNELVLIGHCFQLFNCAETLTFKMSWFLLVIVFVISLFLLVIGIKIHVETWTLTTL